MENKRWNYLETNTDKDNTLVFIHGNSHSSDTFKNQFEENTLLSNYRLIAIDLPGHGDSMKFDSYNMSLFTQELAEFIKFKKLENYILIGHSLGGHVAIEAMTKLAPKGVIAASTPPIGETFDPSIMFQANPALAYLFQPELSIEEQTQLSHTFYFKNKNIEQNLIDFKRTDKKFRETLPLSIASGDFKNEAQLLKSYPEHLLLVGDHDSVTNLEYVNSLGLNVETIPESGHNIHVDQPGYFNKAVNEFANRVF